MLLLVAENGNDSVSRMFPRGWSTGHKGKSDAMENIVKNCTDSIEKPCLARKTKAEDKGHNPIGLARHGWLFPAVDGIAKQWTKSG